MRIIRKIFATITSFIVDVIGGSFLSYLADITFLNKIFYKKDEDKDVKKGNWFYDYNLAFDNRHVVLYRNCFFNFVFKQ